MKPEELTMIIEARTRAAVALALAERDAAHKTKLAELTKRLADLEAAPDPAKAPFRGGAVVALRRNSGDGIQASAG